MDLDGKHCKIAHLYYLCLVSCGTLRSTEIGIHIVALVLSIMITLISTLILAVVLIVWPCKKRNPGVAEYELQNNKVKVMTHCIYRIPTYSTCNSELINSNHRVNELHCEILSTAIHVLVRNFKC